MIILRCFELEIGYKNQANVEYFPIIFKH